MPTHTNPFPGMNPYFQMTWNRVHTRLVAYISDVLAAELPEGLLANPEESVCATGDEPHRIFRPDVALVESDEPRFPPVLQSGGAVAVAEPLVFLNEPETQRWVEIRSSSGELVTIIEVLSPSNKSDSGYEKYRKKQHDIIAAGVSLVEIDLIWSRRRVTAIPAELNFPSGTCYHVCVARAEHSGLERREVYLCPLRQPLPGIRVPLRRGDPDVPLALQPLIEKCVQNARFGKGDYTRIPQPPVAPEDAEWVAERLQEAGLRQ